jgi:hypothetical protein
MKESVMLTIASLLSLLLFSLHVADDIVRGFERGDISNIGALPIFVVWLYATLVLSGRRWGYIIVLLASTMSSAVPVLHMMGKGVGVHSRIGGTSGALFFVWTLLALGTTGLFSVILSARGLWSLQRSRQVGKE